MSKISSFLSFAPVSVLGLGLALANCQPATETATDSATAAATRAVTHKQLVQDHAKMQQEHQQLLEKAGK